VCVVFEYCSSNRVLRSGILTARLLLAVGLELGDDDDPAVGAMLHNCQRTAVVLSELMRRWRLSKVREVDLSNYRMWVELEESWEMSRSR
jgi:hypothetical protein